MVLTETGTDTEKRLRWLRLTQVFEPTGEIIGETEWRRWPAGDP
jgi:hypothetical protein